MYFSKVSASKWIDKLCLRSCSAKSSFRNDLDKIEKEKHMPYITSVERLAKEEGMEKGRLLGKIQMIEQLLGHEETSTEILKVKPLEDLQLMLNSLQQSLRKRTDE